MSTLDRLYAMDRPDAIALLRDSYKTFCSAIEEVQARYPLPPIEPRDGSAREDALAALARNLRHDGVGIVRGLFNDQEALQQARELAIKLKDHADALPDRFEKHLDDELGGVIWTRPLATHYRAGIHPSRLPKAIGKFIYSSLLPEVLARATVSDQKIEPTMTVVDHMVPTDEYEVQWWHQDLIRDQIKAMLILEPVTLENGPMQLIPRTHDFTGPRRMIDFSIFSEGDKFGEIPYHFYHPLKDETLKLTGEPGDVFLFNTRAFHALGRPNVGRRLTMTVYFSALTTPLNRFLDDFHPGHGAV